MLNVRIDRTAVEQIKISLRTKSPDLPSALLTEAIARGLGFGSNAALRMATNEPPASIRTVPSDFVAFLARYGLRASETQFDWATASIAIQCVMRDVPQLTRFGLGMYEYRELRGAARIAKFEELRAEMLSSSGVSEFLRATKWLSNVAKRKTINTDVGTSYGLKHKVEEAYRDYVANGMFIAAAINGGFSWRPSASGSPNAYFNISSKSLLGYDEKLKVERQKRKYALQLNI